MSITAVIVVALTAGEARAAGPGRLLRFDLADGTVVTGRLDAKTIAFRTASGSVLKIPVMDLLEVYVGLSDRPAFVQRVETLIKALDSDRTREDAAGKLIALGPAITPIVTNHVTSDISARRRAVVRILEVYKNWRTDHRSAPKTIARPLRRLTKFHTHSTLIIMGAITAEEFRIASPYGPVTVKREDLYRISPAYSTTPSGTHRWSVALHGKTRLIGMVTNKSLRIRTRHGTMVITPGQIRQVNFDDGGKTIRVQCRNSDRIVGTLAASATISFKTDKGEADIPAGKISVAAHGPLTIRTHSNNVGAIAFSPDGKRLASGGNYNTVKVWDAATGARLLWLKGHSSSVQAVAFSPDGKRLASACGSIRIWHAATGTQLLTFKRLSNHVFCLAFSPDGKRLATGGRGVKLWDAAGGTELRTLKGHSSTVYSVAFSQDGKRLASGGTSVKLWDTITGKELLTLKGHSRSVESVAFSPDGKLLASAGDDKIVRIRNAATGAELFALKGHSKWVYSVAFSPDGKLLASGSMDKTIKLWDTATGKELRTLKGHTDGVRCMAFSPDSKRLASGSDDTTIKIWDVPKGTRAAKKKDDSH